MEISRKKIDTTFSLARIFEHPVAAGQLIEVGNPVFLNNSGLAEAFMNPTVSHIRGIALETRDNTAGQNGDLKIKIETGTFVFNNFGGFGALNFSDIGKLAYFQDSQTVRRFPNILAFNNPGPPIAGVVHGFDDPTRVHVSLGQASANSLDPRLLPTPPPTTSSVYQIINTFALSTVTNSTSTPVDIPLGTNFVDLTGSNTLFVVTGSVQNNTAGDWVAEFRWTQDSDLFTFPIMHIHGNTANQVYNGTGSLEITAPAGPHTLGMQFALVQGSGTLTINTFDFFTMNAVGV